MPRRIYACMSGFEWVVHVYGRCGRDSGDLSPRDGYGVFILLLENTWTLRQVDCTKVTARSKCSLAFLCIAQTT